MFLFGTPFLSEAQKQNCLTVLFSLKIIYILGVGEEWEREYLNICFGNIYIFFIYYLI